MLSVAAHTLRARWVASAGAVLILMLGTGLVTTMALVLAATMGASHPLPQRFAAAPVVVRPQQAAVSGPLLPSLLVKLATTGRVVPDRTFYAQLAGGPADEVGHPWSAAAFTPYVLVAGRPPAGTDQVVVSQASGARPGQVVTVLTAAGPSRYTVAGLTAPVRFEDAVFFSDSEAARLSPAVDAAVVYAPPAAVRRVTGNRAEVLTGAARRLADPGVAAYRQKLLDTETLVGVSGGIAALVAVFVIASASAFAVTQRRREFALLRTVGCTAGRIRRMVLAEATLTAAVGSSVGCLLALPAGSWLGRLLVSMGIAPAGLAVTAAPAALAAGLVTGSGVALLGAWASSRLAGRVPALEAMREAVVNTTAMSKARWVWGLSALGCALAVSGWMAIANPEIVTVPQIYPGAPILTLLAVALLAPAIIGPLARLLCWPLTRTAHGMLVKESIVTGMRSAAHTAVPALVTVALATSLLGSLMTLAQARQTGLHALVRADYVVVPGGTPGLNRALISRIGTVPDIDISTQTSIDVYGPGSHGSVRYYHASAGDMAGLSQVMSVPLVSGSVGDLATDSIVVSGKWGVRVGQTVTIRFSDGQRQPLQVAGVFQPGIDVPDAYLSDRYAPPALADEIFVKVRPGAAVPAAGAALAAAVRGLGGGIVPARAWAGWAAASDEQSTRTGVLLLLGTTTVYSAIAMVTITAMAAAGRRRELALRRLVGITRRRVLQQVATESLLLAMIGILLAAAAVAVNLTWLRIALSALVGSTPIAIPWALVLALGAGSVALTMSASVLTAWKMLGPPAIQVAATPE